MLYIDTSLLVCALTNEANTERVHAWLRQQEMAELTISDWVVTEFSSALSIKLRTGQLEPEHRATALAAFTRLTAQTFLVLPVERTSFRTAARFADQHGANLRAGDALHLAVCAEHGATMCTLDRRLAEAAPGFGVAARLL